METGQDRYKYCCLREKVQFLVNKRDIFLCFSYKEILLLDSVIRANSELFYTATASSWLLECRCCPMPAEGCTPAQPIDSWTQCPLLLLQNLVLACETQVHKQYISRVSILVVSLSPVNSLQIFKKQARTVVLTQRCQHLSVRQCSKGESLIKDTAKGSNLAFSGKPEEKLCSML